MSSMIYRTDISPEEALRKIKEANTPERQAIAKKAEDDCLIAKAQYERGLLTPLDYADTCRSIWSEAEQTLRWEPLPGEEF